MTLVAVGLAVLRTGVAHPASTDVRSGVVQAPTAIRRIALCWPNGGRSRGQIADRMRRRVLCFSGEISAGETHPERSVGIGAGQGRASRGRAAPARYPRMRTGRGCGVSTESRARLTPIRMAEI